MKLDNKLQKLVALTREEIDNLNFDFLANESIHSLTIQDKQKVIKYCKNKIHTARFWSRISRVLSIFFSAFCLLVAYSLLEKVIDNNLVSYVISLAIFWFVNELFIKKFWKVGKDESNYEILLQILEKVK